MRPGPATRAAWFVDASLAFSLPDAVRRHLETAFPKERSSLSALSKSQTRGPESAFHALQWIAQADGSVLPTRRTVRGGRDARLPRCAMTHFGTLRQFTLENRRKRQLYCNLTACSRHLTFALAILCFNKKTSAIEI
jgi:hypothetical protein